MTTISLEPTPTTSSGGGQLNNPTLHSYVDVFSCASLRIAEDDWNSLVHSDMKLAVQVGLLLLRNNKELETVLEATEKQYEEQKLRADHYENQVKNLNELLNQQSEVYSSLEIQIEDLSNKYKLLIDDCSLYKKKNNTLWRRIEWLEQECEEYLEEISILKQDEKNSAVEERLECFEDISNSMEMFEKVNKQTNGFERILEENETLKKRIFDLEEDNKMLEESLQRINDYPETKDTKILRVEPYHYTNPCKIYTEEAYGMSGVKLTPTVQHYHELFAEIFDKLKTTRDDTNKS